MVELDLDFTGETRDTLDNFRCGEGWHLAEVVAVKTDGEKGKMLFSFKVTGDTQKGAVHTEGITMPNYTNDEKGAARAVSKFKAWAARLGLVPDSLLGSRGKVDYQKAVGVKVAIKVTNRRFESDRDGGMVDYMCLDYAPYPLDHTGIDAEARTYLGLPLLPGQKLGEKSPAKSTGGKKGKKDAEAAASASGTETAAPGSDIDL